MIHMFVYIYIIAPKSRCPNYPYLSINHKYPVYIINSDHSDSGSCRYHRWSISAAHLWGTQLPCLFGWGSSLALRAAGAAGGEDSLKSVDINRFNQRKLGKTGKDWEKIGKGGCWDIPRLMVGCYGFLCLCSMFLPYLWCFFQVGFSGAIFFLSVHRFLFHYFCFFCLFIVRLLCFCLGLRVELLWLLCFLSSCSMFVRWFQWFSGNC